MSKSPNIHEAQLALDRAFEIAAKYQVDIQTLDLGDDLNAIVSEACRVGYRLSLTKRLALGVASRFFNVNVVLRYPHVSFIGTKTDIAVARYVFDFLSAEADRCVVHTRKEYRHKFTENRRRNFLAGWFYAINASLDKGKERLALEENRLALVLVNNEARRDQKSAELFPNTVTIPLPSPKRKERTWLYHGFLEGKKVQIRPGIAARGTVELPATCGGQ